MRIYTAARWGRKEEMAEVATALESDGHTVTARWVRDGEKGLPRECTSLMDMGDVAACDVLLSFTEPKGSYNAGGGRHTEFGMAYVLGKKCVNVGDHEQIFHHLPGVITFTTLSAAREYLRRLG
jgi:hypothetical protein